MIGNKSLKISKTKLTNLKNNLPHRNYKRNLLKFNKKVSITMFKTIKNPINRIQNKIQTQILNLTKTRHHNHKVMKILT